MALTEEKLRELEASLLLAEFTKLRDEQFSRTTAQQGLLALNVTGGAVFVAFASQTLSSEGDAFILAMVLLVLPVLSAVLALAYCEQHHSIMKVGLHIADTIERRAQEIAGPEAMSWHAFLLRYQAEGADAALGRQWRRTFSVYMPACFFTISSLAVAVSTATMAAHWHRLDMWQHTTFVVLAVLSVLLMLAVTRLWYSACRLTAERMQAAVARQRPKDPSSPAAGCPET